MKEQRIVVEKNVPAAMRDGTILRSDIYRPDSDGKYPVVLMRIPYNKSDPRYQFSSDAIRVAQNDYAVVWQDCRGTSASDGEFRPFEETQDGYDAVEWAAAQPWSNGKVGMYGGSYVGMSQLAAAVEQPPHLKALCPFMLSSGPRELFFVGGAFQIQAALQWGLFMSLLRLTRKPLPPPEQGRFMVKLMSAMDQLDEESAYLPLKGQDTLKEIGLADFYFEWLEHPDDDAFWKGYDFGLFDKINYPSFLMTGWYDTLRDGTLSVFKHMNEQAGHPVKLIVGPWFHQIELAQQVGDLNFGLASAGPTIDLLGTQIKWFDYWLKDMDNGITDEPPVRIFVMGDNLWRSEHEWPLARTQYTPYYLRSSGNANSLRGDGALTMNPPDMEEFDTYIYDPENPVPTKGGSILTRAGGAGALDQNDIEQRADVLVYTTDALDTDLEVTGPVKVMLFAASSATDTDFTAKLVDVWPDGRAYILTDGILRARYRSSFATQELIEPEKIYEYSIDLGATSSVLKKSHRIRLEISSSNFPRYDRNPNTGHTFGEDAELRMATQRVFHDKDRPSKLILPVIPR